MGFMAQWKLFYNPSAEACGSPDEFLAHYYKYHCFDMSNLNKCVKCITSKWT